MNAYLMNLDFAALRTNQSSIIALSIIAYVGDLIWLVALIGLVMLIGTVRNIPAFGFIYKRLLNPLGWVMSDIGPDHPEPHRFAQGFGSLVMLAGAIALFISAEILGWSLVWLVIALAALNLFVGFCVGCALYYWLNRMRIPGFSQSPPENSLPGMRPNAES